MNNISTELQEVYIDETVILPIIPDIQDCECIFSVVKEHALNVVYHVTTHTYDVEQFVITSTDKVVNSPSVIDSTKRIAEIVEQDLLKRS